MKILIDPLIFWLPPHSSNDELARAIKEIEQSIEHAVFLNSRGHTLTTTQAIRDAISESLLKNLLKHTPSKLYSKIMTLMGKLDIFTAPIAITDTWGVKDLYSFTSLPNADLWMNELARMASFLAATSVEFALFVRPIERRNIKIHATKDCRIYEKTIWQIYVRPYLSGTDYPVPCISNIRNIDVDWTRRYDDYLPDTAPNNGLAFLPPADWESQSLVAVHTRNSKPVWLDAGLNGWSSTNTPGSGHHWDVFVHDPRVIKSLGHLFTTKDGYTNHINITRFGTNDRNKIAGEHHH